MKPKKASDSSITANKRARHDYFIEQTLEAGLVLQGWEVKSLRSGRVQLSESYVILKNSEAWLLGCHITPLSTIATYTRPDPIRTRKLLLHERELSKLAGQVVTKGYALVALQLYWKSNRVKLAVGLARGKKEHDKRAALKERDWQREKSRLARLTR